MVAPINFAAGFQPIQIESPLVQTGRALEIKNAMQRNQLAQMQMTAAQRDIEATNALNAAYQTAYNPATGEIDVNRLRQTLSSGGFGSRLPGIEKSIAEAEKQKLEQKELKGKIEAQPVKMASDRAKAFGDVLNQRLYSLNSIDPASPDAAAQFLAWHEENHKDPILGPELARLGSTPDQGKQRIQQMLVQPGGVDRLISEAKQGIQQFATANTQPSDLARLQSERAAIAAANPNDPRVAQFDAAIAKLTASADHSSELAKYERERAAIFKENPKDPRLKHYDDAIKKLTTRKPDTVLLNQVSAAGSDLVSKAILEGRLDPAKVNSRNIKIIADTLAKDPNADLKGLSIDSASQTKVVKDFTSGVEARQVKSFNTAIDHLETLDKLATALNNGDTPAFNTAANFFARQTGQPAPGNFDLAKEVVGSEVAKALAGSNMALADRQHIRDQILSSASPEQLRGRMATLKSLLGGQLNSLNTQYEAGSGRKDFDKWLSPSAKKEVSALRGDREAPAAGKPPGERKPLTDFFPSGK